MSVRTTTETTYTYHEGHASDSCEIDAANGPPRTTIVNPTQTHSAIAAVFATNVPKLPTQTTSEDPINPHVEPPLLQVGQRNIILNMNAQPQAPDEVTLKESLRKFEQEVHWFTTMISSESRFWLKALTTRLQGITQCCFFTNRLDHLITTFAETHNRDHSPNEFKNVLQPLSEALLIITKQLNESIQCLQQFISNYLQQNALTDYLTLATPFVLGSDSTVLKLSQLITELDGHVRAVEERLNELKVALVLLYSSYRTTFSNCLPCLKALLGIGLKEVIKKMLSANQSSDFMGEALTMNLNPSDAHDDAILMNLTAIAHIQVEEVLNEISIFLKYLINFQYQLSQDLEQCRISFQDELLTVQNAAHLKSPPLQTSQCIPLDQRRISINGLFIPTPLNTQSSSSSSSTASCALHFDPSSKNDPVFEKLYEHYLEALNDFRGKISSLIQMTPLEIVNAITEIIPSPAFFNGEEAPLYPFRSILGESIQLCEASIPRFLEKTKVLNQLVKASTEQIAIPYDMTSKISNLDLLTKEVIQQEYHFRQSLEATIAELKNLIDSFHKLLLEIIKCIEVENSIEKVQSHLSSIVTDGRYSVLKLEFIKSALTQYVVKSSPQLDTLLQVLKQRAFFLNAYGQTHLDYSTHSLEGMHLILSESPSLPTLQTAIADKIDLSIHTEPFTQVSESTPDKDISSKEIEKNRKKRERRLRQKARKTTLKANQTNDQAAPSQFIPSTSHALASSELPRQQIDEPHEAPSSPPSSQLFTATEDLEGSPADAQIAMSTSDTSEPLEDNAFLAIDFESIPEDQIPRLLQLLDSLNKKLQERITDPVDWDNLKVKFRNEA